MPIQIPWPLPHISLLTDTHFDALRLEHKKKASATREKQKMGHKEQHYELASTSNPERRFRLFIRQSTSNPDVFSVGLSLERSEGDLLLCRYNSGHHGHRNILEKQKLPATFHQHMATARYLAAGLDLDGFAVVRSDYSSVDGALAFLLQECNIEGILTLSTQMDLLPP
jgi:hypothetical protein